MLKKITLALVLAVSAYTLKAQQVSFSHDFESGSLDSYQPIDSAWFKRAANDSILLLSYDLFSRFDPKNPIDTTLKPSARWFYFRMVGVKDKQLHLNFHNTDPLRCMYSYDNQTFNRLSPCNAPERGKVVVEFERDTVYLAYFTPYTYSYLQQRIKDWQSETFASTKPYIKVETIGYSTQNRAMQLLTITDPSVPDEQKKRVWMHGRIHTSETPASWHFDGFISALVANTPEAEAIRKSTIFYILPFINPDGVVNGLSRSNVNGVNMEINWARPADSTQQEVKVVKAKMSELTKDRPFDMFLNMHSQVEDKATYWVHKAESTTDDFFRREMLLCYLNASDSPYLYKKDLDFSNVADRYPEGWIWNQFHDTTLAITFETPYTYYNNRADHLWVTTDNLRDFGAETLRAVTDYFGISTPSRIVIDNASAKLRGRWLHESSNSFVYMGSDYVRPSKQGAKITYRLDYLPAGSYKVYAWRPDTFNLNEATNAWVPIQTYQQKKNGKLSLKLRAETIDTRFDAILLVRE